MTLYLPSFAMGAPEVARDVDRVLLQLRNQRMLSLDHFGGTAVAGIGKTFINSVSRNIIKSHRL